jgi:hypothetical protein
MLEYDAELKNVSMDINDDLSGLLSTTKLDLNAAQVEQMIWKN